MPRHQEDVVVGEVVGRKLIVEEAHVRQQYRWATSEGAVVFGRWLYTVLAWPAGAHLGEVDLSLSLASFGADAGGFVLSAGASALGDGLVGVDDARRVDVEEVEVAAGACAVVVSGGGEQVDAAVGVMAFGPCAAMLEAVVVAAIRFHSGCGGPPSGGGVAVVEGGVVIEVGVPHRGVAVQPWAHAVEDSDPGVEDRGGPVDVCR